MASRKRATGQKPAEKLERPSDEPEAVRTLSEENARKAGEALRALKLPNDAEPCVVFRP